MSLAEKLRGRKVLQMPKRAPEPVWKGPIVDGVTQSLLGRYLACPERFRLYVIEGLTSIDRWSAPTGYGDMWHVCEEALAAGNNPDNKIDQWTPLVEHTKKLCRQYPLQQFEINDWYEKCKVQFPIYVEYWAKHPDVRDRVPMFQEHQFDCHYQLPSGRTVRLRGKQDAVDLIGKGDSVGVFVQENKTKSRIEDSKLQRQLVRDLQTMLYVITLREDFAKLDKKWQRYAGKVRGVRYNVVKRPSHKILKNLQEAMAEKPEEFFARWLVTITDTDVERFKTECLHPILENLCDDYEWWSTCKQEGRDVVVAGKATKSWNIWDSWLRHDQFPHHHPRHFLLPYGVYNVIAEGGTGELDEYLANGSEMGLSRVTTLFKELV